jgi:hypothetical protein
MLLCGLLPCGLSPQCLVRYTIWKATLRHKPQKKELKLWHIAGWEKAD